MRLRWIVLPSCLLCACGAPIESTDPATIGCAAVLAACFAGDFVSAGSIAIPCAFAVAAACGMGAGYGPTAGECPMIREDG